jgi:hypothetical protein
VLVFAIVGAVGLAAWLRPVRGPSGSSEPSPLASLVLTAAPFAVLVGAQLAFRLAYYGRWLPNTFSVKVVGLYPAAGLLHFILFVRDNLLGPETVGILIAVPLLLRAVEGFGGGVEHRRVLAASLAAAAAYVAYVILIGGDHFEHRFFHPVVTLLALPFGLGVCRLADMLASSGARAVAVRAAAVLALLAAGRGIVGSIAGFHPTDWEADLGFQKGHVRIVSVEGEQDVCERFSKAGLWLADNAGPEETICLGAMGAIPYYSKLRAVDFLGLTEPEGATFPVRRRGPVGHERRADPAYLLRRGITYYFGSPRLKPPGAGAGPYREVHVDLPGKHEFSFQAIDPEARIQPGSYSAR